MVKKKQFCPSAISSRGLIVKSLVDWFKMKCKKMNKKRNTIDRFLCVKLIVEQLKPHIDKLFQDVNAICQGNHDSKHRSHYTYIRHNKRFIL